jgi:hypothetical protein
MLDETFELIVNNLKISVTIQGDDNIAVLKKRNEIFRFILGIPEVIVLTNGMMEQLEIDDLERSFKL